MNYTREFVLAAFRHQNPGVSDPSASRITDFDEQLFNDFDAELIAQLTAAGEPTDKRTRSFALLLAQFSTSTQPATMVRAAIRFMQNAGRNLDQ
jgi:hypothetical protein